MKLLTIFTPTYNRAYILEKLYKSLCCQTSSDFCWVVVDDGSTDNTRQLVEHWQKENKILIKYFSKENGGKMSAHNYAVDVADTELFMCVDSDDELSCDAVEIIKKQWRGIKNNNMVAGIIAYTKVTNSKVISAPFPDDIYFSKLSSLYMSGYVGETALIFRKSVLKKYKFPEIPGEKFITEDYVYDQIDQEYIYCLLRKICIIAEYRPDGYTYNALKLKRDNPVGWYLYYEQRAKFSTTIIGKFRNLAYANCFKGFGGVSIKNTMNNKIMNLIAVIPGLYLALRYNKEFRKLK